jgi:hypothetical protein
MPKPNHSILITAACVLWSISLVAEFVGISPFTWIGIITAPMLLITGIIFWARDYKEKKGHYPRGKSIWDNVTTSGGAYTLRPSYLREKFREFVTFWFAAFMIMTLIGHVVFNCSDAFKATQAYCEANPDVLKQTGKIKRYGLFVAGSISTYNARLSFSVFGEKGHFDLVAEVQNQDGMWVVDSVKF